MKNIFITVFVTSLLGGSIIAPTPTINACVQIYDEEGNWINEQEYLECVANEQGISLFGYERPNVD